jgi:hydroxyacylglutathione hydrolase
MESVLSSLEITPIPCLRDNYAYLLRCKSTGFTAVVDPSEGSPVLAALDGRLDYILNTHHHWDHTGGNEALLEAYPQAAVFGHASDRGRIPGQTHFLDDGETIEVGLHKARILFVPGHTTGAIAYHFRDDLFTGDTLFIAGCGRVFEGTAAMMHASLQRLAALSPQTRVWVGHEYTLANLGFAQAAEPDNKDLVSTLARAAATRKQGLATVPSSIELELKINPFLRAETDTDFARLRSWKDRY